MITEDIAVSCDDGITLRGELLIPEAPRALVQFNCGTATKRGVYRKLLTYLCEQGFLCCLWDYRGSGKSDGELKHSDIIYADYGIKDMPSIKAYLQQRYPELPFLLLAHSAGGQQVGFMHDLSGIKGMVSFGVSAAYFRYMPLAYRLQAYAFFYGVAPVTSRTQGYVNASALGLMEDLPSGVARQWRDWLTTPDYFFDKRFYGVSVPTGAFQSFEFPIHNYHASDDSISTPRNIDNFWRHIESSQPITFERILPADAGLKQIDHFGYFKSVLKDSLWADVARRLGDMAES